jgi:N-methylhydantoinase A
MARLLDQLAEVEATSVAVCLIFSFLRPEHELQIATAIRAARAAATGRGEASPLPAYISLSSQILPEYREYERTATTVINAYVTPLMRDYLQTLASGLAPRTLAVMQSNGGIISAAAAGAQAARTVLSGPAGGVVGASYLAETAGFEDVITFDMGGTSTDVALCPGRLPTTSLGEIAGLPLRLPIIDIHTVGAGGGSLARVDPGGALRVGPESAGADPGPVCYGRGGVGGDETANLYVTTTDANLVLGRLDAGHFLGGEMVLDEPQARRALAQLARQMGAATLEAAAWDVVRVANVTMERAIRRISLERGFDPRRFALVAFGGAGPLHACDLARALQIPRVLVPLVPGVLSALGMLVAAPTKDYSQTVLAQGGGVGGGAGLERSLIALEARATADFAAEGYAGSEINFRYSLDMRYVGQSHELTVGFTRDELVASETPALPSRFHEHHQRRYGYQRPGAAVEIVTARLVATVATTPPLLEVQAPGTGAQPIGEKAIWFEGALQPTSLYRREQLAAGDRFSGPAVVFQYDTTTVVPPDWLATVDPFGNLIISA